MKTKNVPLQAEQAEKWKKEWKNETLKKLIEKGFKVKIFHDSIIVEKENETQR